MPDAAVGVGHFGGELQAQRFHSCPCVGIRNAGLGQAQQLLCAAGGDGSLVGVLVGEGRGLHAGKVVGNALQKQAVVEHCTAGRPHCERGTGVGQAFQGDHRPGCPQSGRLVVQAVPCGTSHDAIYSQPRKALVGPHGSFGGSTELSVDANGRDAALVGAHEVEVELQLPHRCAGGAFAQHARVLAGAQAGRQQLVGDVVVHLV